MTQISRLRAAVSRRFESARADRAARAQRIELETSLRSYTSKSERAELDAILGRHTESDTHQVWHTMAPLASSGSWARA